MAEVLERTHKVTVGKTIEIDCVGESQLLIEWAGMNSFHLKVISIDPQTGEIMAGYNFKGTIIECPFAITSADIGSVLHEA